MADKKEVSLASLNVAQKVLAVDARYNSLRLMAYPRQRTQYIRRRNQLLRDNASRHEETAVRAAYLHLRVQVLRSKFGPLHRHREGSLASSSHTSRRASMESLHLSPETSSPRLPRRQLSSSLSHGLVPTKSAEASRAMAGNETLAEHYTFSGMHHIFGQHQGAVVAVRFAHNDKSRLACCSHDGTLSVFSLASEPPVLACSLRGHTAAVNDFDWSVANDYLVSASSDGTCRLWEASAGHCLRAISDTSGAQNLSCCFHPAYSNFVAVGNSKSQVKVFNASTGMAIKGGQGKTAGAVLTMTFESSGDVLWVGDSKGSVFSFLLDVVSGKLTRAKRIVVSSGHPVTSIAWRSWVSREARDPSLLISCANNALILYRVLSDGSVYRKREFTQFKHTSENIRSAFCPLMSFMLGACVVTGSEDGMLYFFDVETGSRFNQLSGHLGPVRDVCWAYDESLLASCDTEVRLRQTARGLVDGGTVIIWKRAKSSISGKP